MSRRTTALTQVWLLMVAIGVVPGCANLALGDSEQRIDLVDAWLRDENFSGSVLVAHHDIILLDRGYGLADRSNDVPNTPETIYPIASITKPITATAILRLADEGRLDLDDPVATYLPDFPDGNRITIHHLLTHRSGLPRDLSEHAQVSDGATVAEALAAYPRFPLAFDPGASFAYSNLGYEVLSSIIELASGISYENYIQATFFGPIGMTQTGVAVEPLRRDGVAIGYIGDRDGSRLAPPLWASWWKGAGGVYSTTGDLLRWEQALRGGDILSASSHAAMLTEQGGGYGYGWFIGSNPEMYWHDGDLQGFHSWLVRDSRRGLTVIALSNDDRSAALGDDLVSLYLDGDRLQNSRVFDALLLVAVELIVTVAAWALSTVLRFRRGTLVWARPRRRRVVLQVLLPLALALLVVSAVAEPYRVAGSWREALLIVPAWSRVLLATGAFLVLSILVMMQSFIARSSSVPR